MIPGDELVRRLAAPESSTDEKQRLLAQLAKATLPTDQLLTLIRSGDDETRRSAGQLFLAEARGKQARELVLHLEDRPSLERERLLEVARALPRPVVQPVSDSLLTADSPIHRRIGWDTAVSLAGELRLHYLKRAARACVSTPCRWPRTSRTPACWNRSAVC